MMTHKEAYEKLYKQQKTIHLKLGLSEDKSSRRANVYAVKNTKEYLKTLAPPPKYRGTKP